MAPILARLRYYPLSARQKPAATVNVGPALQSVRCGVWTRADTACQSPAMSAKHRCRMHDSATDSGARAGNRNALKHGRYSREIAEFRRRMQELLHEASELIEIV